MLTRLQPLCLSLPTASRTHVLQFRDDELHAVNKVWTKSGLPEVLRIWGAERGGARTENSNHRAWSQGELFLTISETYYPKNKPSREDGQYRRRDFKLSEPFISELLIALHETGLIDTIFPAKDSIHKVPVRTTPIERVSCNAEWYGPENWYGDGMRLNFACGVRAFKDRDLEVRFSFLPDGCMQAYLWDPSLYESGYEGHDGRSFELTKSEIRAMLGTLAKIPEQKALTPRSQWFGAWHLRSNESSPSFHEKD